jgi:predicted DNA-binding transcriptional regulator AlpA
MKTKQIKEKLISGPNLARYLDLDPATPRRWVRDEGCPHHVLGDKLIRYKLSEVLAWRAERKGKPRKAQPVGVVK